MFTPSCFQPGGACQGPRGYFISHHVFPGVGVRESFQCAFLWSSKCGGGIGDLGVGEGKSERQCGLESLKEAVNRGVPFLNHDIHT